MPVLVLEPISERIGRIKTHASCLAIMAAGYFAMFLAGTTPIAMYVLMAVIAVGWASMISLPFAIMSQKIDKAQTGLYMGLFNLSIVLPQLVVSLGVSLALSRAEDKSLVFIIAALAIALAAGAWPAWRERTRRGSTQPARRASHQRDLAVEPERLEPSHRLPVPIRSGQEVLARRREVAQVDAVPRDDLLRRVDAHRLGAGREHLVHRAHGAFELPADAPVREPERLARAGPSPVVA